jgi:hypothetical protein
VSINAAGGKPLGGNHRRKELPWSGVRVFVAHTFLLKYSDFKNDKSEIWAEIQSTTSTSVQALITQTKIRAM